MSYLLTYKIPQPRGYDRGTYYIEDLSSTSPDYFDIVEFPTVMGGGRHIIKLRGNGINMRLNSTVDIEILDRDGNNIYCETVNYIDRFNNFYISVDIYDITARGLATAYIVGEAQYDLRGNLIPQKYKDQYNVRWKKTFNILPFERNNADLIFNNPPQVSLAQVISPARIKTIATSSAVPYSVVTSSVNLLNIATANFFGYDRDFQSSADILDNRLKAIRINPLKEPSTTNSVPTALRQKDTDIENGAMINFTTRFNTILQATSSFFKKEHLGSYFEFFSSQSTPANLQPALPSGVAVLGSTYAQFDLYNSLVVEVVNDRQVILSKPLTITTVDTTGVSKSKLSTFNYKYASIFTGSLAYIPSDTAYVTSSTVSQSYLELTFGNLNPISGEVYRIRTSAKLSDITGDYKLLNDQIINPVEYLTDAEFPNATNYSKHESDYRMIGHFTTQSIFNDYWTLAYENPAGFDIVTGSVRDTTMIEAIGIPASFTQSAVVSTQYSQNYNSNQIYTLGFYLTLDPYTELEVYMGSDPLNSHIILPLTYPKAFFRSDNNEKNRYSGNVSRFGKYIGKITNDRSTSKYYGKVLFDFETDANGFGNPVLRSRVIDEMANTTGSAYVGEISIKPYTINGFTPNIVQYAVPLPQEFVVATALSQSIDIKIDYFDYNGKQSEYATFIDDAVINLKTSISSNACQDDKLYFYYYSGVVIQRASSQQR
jgi:hypothetical protein